MNPVRPLALALGVIFLALAPPAVTQDTATAATRAKPDQAAPSTAAKAAGHAANDAETNGGEAELLRAQILLDRSRFSPGEIDGRGGSNTRRAIAAFQASRDLESSGELDEATWKALNADTAPVLVEYTITEADVAGPFRELPADMMEKSELDALGFETAAEALGEKFHASPALLQRLNPDARLAAGARIVVPHVAPAAPLPEIARVVVDKSDSVLRLLDADGGVVAQFPASTGSERDPLPIGEWKIQGVALDPTFHYDPELFWNADASHAKAVLPPGPNSPVGVAWVDLSKEHYGIHGTSEPSQLGKTDSNGCIRLSNWDVLTVAGAVRPGTPAVLQE